MIDTIVDIEKTNKMKYYLTGIGIIGLIIELFVYMSAFQWIDKLEYQSCKCSEHNLRDYLKVWIPIRIIFGIIFFIVFMSHNYFKKINGTFAILFGVLHNLMSIFVIAGFVIAIYYIEYLKNIDCKCSEDQNRDIYYIYNWIQIGLHLLPFAIFLILILGAFFYAIAVPLIKTKRSKSRR